MDLTPEQLDASGYKILAQLDHKELVPFVRKYLGVRTWSSNLYYLFNIMAFGGAGYYMIRGWKIGYFTLEDGLSHLCYGLAIAFALLPLHEGIHGLAYKSQGALQTAYIANWKKFYFMAVADRFVASGREFRIVAIAPFLIITVLCLLLMIWASPEWKMTWLGVLMTHTAFCSGDFGLLSFFDHHRDQEVITYDDRSSGLTFFLGRPVEK